MKKWVVPALLVLVVVVACGEKKITTAVDGKWDAEFVESEFFADYDTKTLNPCVVTNGTEVVTLTIAELVGGDHTSFEVRYSETSLEWSMCFNIGESVKNRPQDCVQLGSGGWRNPPLEIRAIIKRGNLKVGVLKGSGWTFQE